MQPKHEHPRRFVDPSSPNAHNTARVKLQREMATHDSFALFNDPWDKDPWVGGRHRRDG